jgi:hypothetical protein
VTEDGARTRALCARALGERAEAESERSVRGAAFVKQVVGGVAVGVVGMLCTVWLSTIDGARGSGGAMGSSLSANGGTGGGRVFGGSGGGAGWADGGVDGADRADTILRMRCWCGEYSRRLPPQGPHEEAGSGSELMYGISQVAAAAVLGRKLYSTAVDRRSDCRVQRLCC